MIVENMPNRCCRRCSEEGKEGVTVDGIFMPRHALEMFVCTVCGNKRCPHANDRRHECTASNEPGQPGSAYA